jgi:NADPH-dependent glutamate synthase beta subunit-like oxidoreductase
MGYECRLDQSMAEQFGLATEGKGRIILGAPQAAEGVFVAGDLASGPSYVVSAISSGRKAAKQINEYLAK